MSMHDRFSGGLYHVCFLIRLLFCDYEKARDMVRCDYEKARDMVRFDHKKARDMVRCDRWS